MKTLPTFAMLLLLGIFSTACSAPRRGQAAHPSFDGTRALADVRAQVTLGARVPGSASHAAAQAYIRSQLEAVGWQVATQETQIMGHPVHNLYAFRQVGAPDILLGAHYDTRPVADQDIPAHQATPIPGANDGASGVAILLELARSLPPTEANIWLVFFDLEDSGNLPAYDWSLGAQAFARWIKNNQASPQAVIIVDMVGDRDLTLYYEGNSEPSLQADIWQTAAHLGYAQNFIPQKKYTMLDDHLPFAQAGIPSALLIDFDYPYWHTLHDTTDKVSAESLKIVGETLRQWLMAWQPDKTVTR